MFATLEDALVDAWLIIIEEDIDRDSAASIHEDHDGQPFALVTVEEGWSLTASHELTEMAELHK